MVQSTETVHIHGYYTPVAGHRECVRAGWRCTRCGNEFVDNPRLCRACGYTIYAPLWRERSALTVAQRRERLVEIATSRLGQVGLEIDVPLVKNIARCGDREWVLWVGRWWQSAATVEAFQRRGMEARIIGSPAGCVVVREQEQR